MLCNCQSNLYAQSYLSAFVRLSHIRHDQKPPFPSLQTSLKARLPSRAGGWGPSGACIYITTYIQVSRAPSELLAVCPYRQESGQGHAAGSFGALACAGLLAKLFKQEGGKMTCAIQYLIFKQLIFKCFSNNFVHWLVEISGGSNQIWGSNQFSHLIKTQNMVRVCLAEMDQFVKINLIK